MIKTQEEVARDWLNQAASVAKRRFRDAVKPIYGIANGGTLGHIGSAILLEISQRKFILTARHVFDCNTSTQLHIGADTTTEPLPTAEAITSAETGSNLDGDQLDFALVPIPPKLAQKFSNAKFVSENEISKSTTYVNGQNYTCLGFPNSKNAVVLKRVKPSLLPYTSNARPAQLLPERASESNHVLIDYDKKHVRGESGTKINAVALRGCSGGAIIELGSYSVSNLASPPTPQIAAVLIEAYPKEKVIVGTRLTTILQALPKRIWSTCEN